MEETKPIEIGKKVILRPVISESPHLSTPSSPHEKRLVTKQNLRRKAIAANLKKQLAQDLYYCKYMGNENKGPVHNRLGPVRYQKFKRWFHNQPWVKPRIKVGQNGLTTLQYRQKAQQRLQMFRHKLQYRMNRPCYQVQFHTNTKSRFPQIFHSVKGCLDEDLQQEIKLLMEDCVRSSDVDNEFALDSEDITELKIHERFSMYP